MKELHLVMMQKSAVFFIFFFSCHELNVFFISLALFLFYKTIFTNNFFHTYINANVFIIIILFKLGLFDELFLFKAAV